MTVALPPNLASKTLPPELRAKAQARMSAAIERAGYLLPDAKAFLRGFSPILTERLPTLAVTKEMYLLYNPWFVLGETEAGKMDIWELGAAFLHESLHVYFKHFLRSETFGEKILRERGEVYDHHRGNLCFPAGTLLATGRPIEAPGYETYSMNGALQGLQPMRRPYKGKLYRFLCNNVWIESTDEHPFYVYCRRRPGQYPIRTDEGGWLIAKEIEVKDYLVVPAFRGSVSTRAFDLRPYAEDHASGVLYEEEERRISGRTITEFPLDEDTAWLLGLYVAEGSGVSYVQLSLGLHEADTLGARASRIAERLGYVSQADVTVNKAGLRVRIGGTVLARFLHDHCGRGAFNKHAPDFILRHEDLNLVRAFLRGLADGDGYDREDPAAEYTVVGSVSKTLAMHIRLLLARLGLGCWTQVQIPKKGRVIAGGKPVESQNPLHVVGWAWKPKTTKRVLNGQEIDSWSREWRPVPEGIAYPVKKIEVVDFDGTVYNAETIDHTYVAEGFIVHNSQDTEINSLLVNLRPINPIEERIAAAEFDDLSAAEPWASRPREDIVTEARRRAREQVRALPEAKKYPLPDWPKGSVSLPKWFWYPSSLNPKPKGQPWGLLWERYYPFVPHQGGQGPGPEPPKKPWSGFHPGDRVVIRSTGEEGVVVDAGPFNEAASPPQEGIVVFVTNASSEPSREVEDAARVKVVRDSILKSGALLPPEEAKFRIGEEVPAAYDDLRPVQQGGEWGPPPEGPRPEGPQPPPPFIKTPPEGPPPPGGDPGPTGGEPQPGDPGGELGDPEPEAPEAPTESHECGAAGETPDWINDIVRDALRRGEAAPPKGEAEVERLRREVQKETQRSEGALGWGGGRGAAFKRMTDHVLAPPRIPWDEKLRSTLQTLDEKLGSLGEPTYSRLGRRTYALYGSESEYIEPSETGSEGQDVVLIVDTSGSVSTWALSIALKEIAALASSENVARILFIASDSAVGAVETILPEEVSGDPERAREKLEPLFIGGGGTDADVALVAVEGANEERQAEGLPPVPAIVVFTDGLVGRWPSADRFQGADILVVLLPSFGGRPLEAAAEKLEAELPEAEVILAED